MELHLVTCKNSLQTKNLLIRNAFDDKDAIVKARKNIDPGLISESTFKVNKVTFNQYDTYFVG